MFTSSSLSLKLTTTLFNNNPLSLFHHHHPHPLTCQLSSPRSFSRLSIKLSQNFHTQSIGNSTRQGNSSVSPSHPWTEWVEFIEYVPNNGEFDVKRMFKDEIVSNESLSMEFVDNVCLCLEFAQDRPDIVRLLPKDDIEVLVNNGTPFLFRNTIETEKRMRSFLQGEESSEATTVDLMKYILSYASNPIIHPERNIKEDIESCARNLLRKIAKFNGRVEALNMSAEDEQTPKDITPISTMKRGDWICRKCSFMNFATNAKCLECEELRPRRLLTGSEWDCPECNFLNHGRNVVCLFCQCRRACEVPLPIGQVKIPANPNGSASGYAPFVPLPADLFAKQSDNKTDVKYNSEPKTIISMNNSEKSATKGEARIKDNAEEEKSERWFKKVAEFHDDTDLTSAISDDDFPEIMPMRKGENRFVVSKKKDRSLTSSTYKRQQATGQVNTTTNFVPFVPFPPDYFAKKENNQKSNKTNSSHTNDKNLVQETRNIEINRTGDRPETSKGKRDFPENQNVRNGSEENSTNSGYMSHRSSSKSTNNMNLVQETEIENRPTTSNGVVGKSENQNVRNGWEGSSLEGSAVKETDPLDMSEEAKAERWFRRVAQIKDISELSQIPDEDFPSIMPMRKGVNRFVVSKRKTPLERRLTSPQYRKNLGNVSSEPSKKEVDGS